MQLSRKLGEKLTQKNNCKEVVSSLLSLGIVRMRAVKNVTGITEIPKYSKDEITTLPTRNAIESKVDNGVKTTRNFLTFNGEALELDARKLELQDTRCKMF